MVERYRSYQYRKLMGLTVAQYDTTPALTVDWDMQFHRLEQDIERDAAERARQQARGGA